ncbi:hypothetical protein GCM10023196_035800 [Actinoallomurus vinaceus]|uniref:Uncharacterized protein n=1 Tax=Actinoallomurus vinaceus TaxID=1080074 RepID=A0ABP8U8X4_9ACTN
MSEGEDFGEIFAWLSREFGLDEDIEGVRAALGEILIEAVTGNPDITYTRLGDGASLLEVRAQLKPHTESVDRHPRVRMAFSAEFVIRMLERITGAQHWKHPEIEIGGHAARRDDGTTELVPEGRVRVYLLIRRSGDGGPSA